MLSDSNATEREISPREPISYLWRLAGVMFLFFPLGSFAAFVGAMIGDASGPRPARAFGWALNSGDVARLDRGFACLCALLALVWVLGRPRWPAGAIRFFTGFGMILLTLVGVNRSWEFGLGGLLFTALGSGLLLHSLVGDRPPRISGASAPGSRSLSSRERPNDPPHGRD